jgi:hypothetical protein
MDSITELYHKRGYLDVHALDVLISATIIITITMGTGYSNYKSMIMSIQSEWDVYRCNPLIMPFAGTIMPVQGKSSNEITLENFQYCVKKDTAVALSIATLPIELILYTTIEFMDGLQKGIRETMSITEWLLKMVLEESNAIINKFKQIMVPIQEILIYIRDAIAKSNAVLTTALYVVMNVYNIIVSGTINLMKILSNFVISFTVIMLALAILAFILIPTPATVAGWAIYASAASILAGNIIPGIVFYTILRIFITAISTVTVDKPPPKPTLKKKKKK